MVVSGHDRLRNFELGWHGSLFFRGATWALAHSTYASYPSGQHSYTRGQLPGFASSVQFLASRLGHRLPASLKEAGRACLGFVASGNADGREGVLDEISGIGYRDPFTDLVASPHDSVVRGAHLALQSR